MAKPSDVEEDCWFWLLLLLEPAVLVGPMVEELMAVVVEFDLTFEALMKLAHAIAADELVRIIFTR